MTPLQNLARGTFHDWLDLPPWPTEASIRLRQEADEQAQQQDEDEQ